MRELMSRATAATPAARLAGAAGLLLAVCTLAAGCGSGHVSATAAAAASTATSATSATSATAGSTGTAGTASSAAPGQTSASTAAPTPSAAASSAVPANGTSTGTGTGTGPPATTPVTTSGGTGLDGQPLCTGWPSGAHGVRLPVSFTPVSVERCVHGTTDIPGKGLWVTATLELTSALRQPDQKPAGACPAIAILPPQVLLTGADGERLVPLLPATSCALVQSRVLAALDALHWQTVSIRLINPLHDVNAPATTTPAAPGTASEPHAIRTGAATP
jgi:hypothetical protein